MNLGFRLFYRADVKPWIKSRQEEIHRAYVGPGWTLINGYEKLGRIIGGTALVLSWIVLCVATAVLFLVIVVNVVEGLACLFNPGCTVSFRPPY